MNILRLTTLVLISILLMPFDASAHCDGKHTGNHPHCDGGGDDGSGEYTGSEGVQFVQSGEPGFPSRADGYDYFISGTAGRDTITAGSSLDFIEGGDDGDDIQALAGNDRIHGDNGDDSIDAGEGNDFIYGGAGTDYLVGGPGTDWLEGGDGNDRLYFSVGASLGWAIYDVDHFDGNQGYDELAFGDWAGPGGYAQINGVTVDLAMNTYEANVTDLSGEIVIVKGDFLSIEDIWASRGNDFLYGSDYTDNNIYGWEGDDVIHGLGGNDRLIGGQGNDEVFGGPGDDEVGGEPGDDLVVGGDGNDIVSGSESGVGDLTDDELWGGNQDDPVPVGKDTFRFRKSFGTDTIMDYQQDETIHLTGLVGGFYRNEMSYDVLNIDKVGADIVISFWLKRGGGAGGTIILKNAAARGIVVNDSDFIID